jgi:hypothetical protein
MGETKSNRLIEKLESPEPLGHRDKAAFVDAIDALFPGRSMWPEAREEKSESADVALHVAEKAFPNWDVMLTGKTNPAHGNWVCTLRESAASDDDEVIGIGNSPVLAYAIFAACLKLAAKKHHL